MPMKLLLALLLSVFAGYSALAQSTFPSQPVRIINGFAAGGSTDLVQRTLAEELKGVLNQAVVSENKPGANGIIAMEEVARSKPDGYTLFIGNSSGATALIQQRDKLSFDPEQKFTILAALAEGPPATLSVRKDVPANTLAELVAYAKANPGKLRYASPGTQTSPHLDFVNLARRTGFEFIHLPQKGAGGIVPALVNGDAQIAVVNIASIQGQVKSGDVKLIALLHPKRLRDFPDVPTVGELGHPDVGTVLWHAMYVHADTPADIQQKLSDAIKKGMKGEKMQALYKNAEMIEPSHKTLADDATWLKAEMSKLRKLIAEIGDVK